MTQPPLVWILLINWNTWKDTVECLESLLRQDYPNYRVVICDNGSSDDSVAQLVGWGEGRVAPPQSTTPELRTLTEPPMRKPVSLARLTRSQADAGTLPSEDALVTILDLGENTGFSGGTNIAIRYARRRSSGGYVWLVNNDMIVAPDALSRLVALAESDERIGAVGGEILEYREPDRIQIPGGGHVSLWNGFPVAPPQAGRIHGSPDSVAQSLDFIAYGCLVARFSALDRVGLLDERYFLYCEDVDHSLRFRRAGYELAYDPDARVWHKGGASVGYRSARHDFYMARNSLLLVGTFAPARLPVAFAYSLYRCVLPKLVRGQFGRLRAVWNGYRSFVAQQWGREQALRHGDRMLPSAKPASVDAR
jgi:GT2 family glycosyltransferase